MTDEQKTDRESTVHPILLPLVSDALKKGKDGNKRLTKSRLWSHPVHGQEEIGGYRVVSGVTRNTAAVQWIPPDSLPWEKVEREKERFLDLYTAILVDKGFLVSRESYGLSVEKKTTEDREITET